MALPRVGTGIGVARRNMVKTAAMKLISQFTIWEKTSERLVPKARRKILRLAVAALGLDAKSIGVLLVMMAAAVRKLLKRPVL